jgi:hypothetical protein
MVYNLLCENRQLFNRIKVSFYLLFSIFFQSEKEDPSVYRLKNALILKRYYLFQIHPNNIFVCQKNYCPLRKF